MTSSISQEKVLTAGDLKKLERMEMVLGKTKLFCAYFAAPSSAEEKQLVDKKRNPCRRTNSYLFIYLLIHLSIHLFIYLFYTCKYID